MFADRNFSVFEIKDLSSDFSQKKNFFLKKSFKMCSKCCCSCGCPQWPDRCCLCCSKRAGSVFTGLLSILGNLAILLPCVYALVKPEFWAEGEKTTYICCSIFKSSAWKYHFDYTFFPFTWQRMTTKRRAHIHVWRSFAFFLSLELWNRKPTKIASLYGCSLLTQPDK